VFRGTGGAEAGLKGTTHGRSGQVAPGNIVQEIDGMPVKSFGELLRRPGSYKPGETVTLTAWREDKTHKVRVRLQAPE
jgi:S1-C subfamily serine protease